MGLWYHKEPRGGELRELINQGDHQGILKYLYEVSGHYCKTLQRTETIVNDELLVMDEEQFSDMQGDFYEFHYLIEGEWDYDEDDLEEYGGWSSMDELVDDRLTQFYDLCDKHRIWCNLL